MRAVMGHNGNESGLEIDRFTFAKTFSWSSRFKKLIDCEPWSLSILNYKPFDFFDTKFDDSSYSKIYKRRQS